MPLALRVSSLFALFVLCLLVSSRAFAQTETATLSGVIQDPNGAIVPDVEVSATRIETGSVVRTNTNGAGIYVLTGLMPGHYHLLIHKPGFKEIAIKEFELHVQDKLEQNFSLAIGSVSETVTVSAQAEHLPTDNPAVGVLVNRDFVENMPLNGRSFQDLIALAPGAVSGADGSGLFSINGQRNDANYFTVDGVAANTNPGVSAFGFQALSGAVPAQTVFGTTQALSSVDTLQEFKIQTAGYTAESGRQPGGQIAITTRSGSNDIHGSLFEYFRNDVLDANDWFFNQNGISRQPERQNDFGGTLGGPLIIPRIYRGKDKTFYFVSYEALRLREPQFSGILDVPTVAFRQFAAPGVQTFLNATPLPNPSSSGNGDQCALSAGETFSCTAQFSAPYSNTNRLDSMSFRIDQVIGQQFEIFLRYSDTPSSSYYRNFGSQANTTTTNTHLWTLGVTSKLASNLLDEFRFNYTVSSGQFGSRPGAFDGAVPYLKSVLIPPEFSPGNAPAQDFVLPFLPNADFFAVPSYALGMNRLHQLNFVDSVSWTHDKHALKFGADYRRLATLYNPPQYFSELVLTSLTGVQQGFADSVGIEAASNAHPVFNNLSLYIQDHWKVTSRLTVDYGLRWELNPSPGASDGLYPLALTSSNLATAQIAARGTPQYRTAYHNFGPRLGFAYQLGTSQTHSLVIRGGFGIFYDTGQNLGATGYTGFPFQAFSNLTNVSLPASNTALTPPSLNVPLVAPYPFISGISDPNLTLPYTEQWNLSFDQGLSAKNTLTFSYVGNTGRNLLFQQDRSNFNPAFTEIFFTSNAASSTYHALQVQDRGYVAPGMQLIASYTLAHAIDNASTDFATSALGPVRGNSDNDVRQVLNVALNYLIPGTNSNEFVRALTHGWSMDSRFTVLSGYPVDVIQGTYSLPDGTSAIIRPDLVPGVPIYLHHVPEVLGGWALNPAAFSSVPTDPNTGAPLRAGTLGRNFIHGPGFWNLNLAAQRNFPLYEQLQLVFRAEAFNILNHPNAGGIDTCLCDSTFGQSNNGTPTVGVANRLYANGSPRSLQVVLKLVF